MKFDPKPTILRPFDDATLQALQEHIRHIRRVFDLPGLPYHDVDAVPSDKFNRWFWHNLPALVELHHSPKFISLASELFGRDVKPSYAFLSMYGPNGVCPPHTDRPQCQFTIDLQVESDGQWPIFVSENPYILKDGEALAYSGTGQRHYRNPMSDGYTASNPNGTQPPPLKTPTFMNLAFFHFVPTNWMGKLS